MQNVNTDIFKPRQDIRTTFEVVMAITMKITVFWNVMTWSAIYGHQGCGGICCLHPYYRIYLEDGGSKFLRNGCTCLSKYTASYLRRE